MPAANSRSASPARPAALIMKAPVPWSSEATDLLTPFNSKCRSLTPTLKTSSPRPLLSVSIFAFSKMKSPPSTTAPARPLISAAAPPSQPTDSAAARHGKELVVVGAGELNADVFRGIIGNLHDDGIGIAHVVAGGVEGGLEGESG